MQSKQLICGLFAPPRIHKNHLWLILAAALFAGCGGGGKKGAPLSGPAVPAQPALAAGASDTSASTPLAAEAPTAGELQLENTRVVNDAVYGPVVSGQVWVSLPQTTGRAASAESLAQAHGLKVIAAFPELGVAVLDTAGATPGELAAKLSAAGVEAAPNAVMGLSGVFNDPAFSAADGQDRQALEQIQAWPWLEENNHAALSPTITLLDTGVMATHPELSGRVLAGPSFVDKTPTGQDENGHGTAMAGLLAGGADNGLGASGVCPGCRVQSLRVCNAKGECPVSAIVSALVWAAADKKAQVIHLPLNIRPKDTLTRRLIENATTLLQQRGLVVVTSAGNEGKDATGVLPVGLKGVLAVGAVDMNDAIAPASNFGPQVALFAPGEALTGLDGAGGFRRISGTSGASALAAGSLTLLMAAVPGLSVENALAAFKATGTPVAGQTGSRLNLKAARDFLGNQNIPPAVGVDLTGATSATGTLRIVVSVRHPAADGVDLVIHHGLKGQTATQVIRRLEKGKQQGDFTLTVATPKNGTLLVSATAKSGGGLSAVAAAERRFDTFAARDLRVESSAPNVALGGVVRFTVKAKTTTGLWQDVTHQTTFTITPTAALSRSPGETAGAFYALQTGNVNVKAVFAGLSKTLLVTVTAPNTADTLLASLTQAPGPAPEADGRRPAAPTRLTVQMQCPSLVFSWAAPTQDDNNNDGAGDSPLTGLVGYNLYSGSAPLGGLDPMAATPIYNLSPVNGGGPGNLIPAVSYDPNCQNPLTESCSPDTLVAVTTYSLNPRVNQPPVNFAVTAHDGVDPERGRNASLSSQAVNVAYGCQPTSDLSATFTPGQCGGGGTVRLTWNDVDDDGIYRVYRKTGVNPVPPVPTTHGGADQPVATAPNQGGQGVVSLDVPVEDTEGKPSTYFVSVWDGCNEETAPVALNPVAPVVADCTPPAPPTSVSVEENPEGDFTLEWEHDGTDVKEYHVYRALSPDGPWVLIRTLGPDVRECDDVEDDDPAVVSRQEDENFFYIVRASDGENESPATGPVQAAHEDTTAPPPVRDVTASRSPQGNPELKWKAPVETPGGAPPDDLAGFNVYRSKTPSFTEARLVATLSPSATTFTDTSISPDGPATATGQATPLPPGPDGDEPMDGEFYYYFIETFDPAGNRGPVPEDTPAAVICTCKPKPPKTLSASNIVPDDGGRLMLTWEKSPHDNGRTFATFFYAVYRRTVSPLSGSFELAGTVPGTQSAVYTWVDDGGGALLDDDTQYEYQIRAVGDGWPSNASNTSKAQPLDELAPDAPENLRVEMQCPDLSVSWDRPSRNTLGQPLTDLAGYKLYRSENGGAFTLVATVRDTTGHVNYLDDPGPAALTEHLTYSYLVVAFDDGLNPAGLANTSSQSAIVDQYKNCVGAPLAPIVLQQCVMPPKPSTLALTFNSGPNPTGAPITGFVLETADHAAGPWRLTGVTVAYLGPNLTHSAALDYPGFDGVYHYRLLAQANYGGGLTLESNPSPPGVLTATCQALIAQGALPSEKKDCGYTGNPWFAATNPTTLAQPQDATYARDPNTGTANVFVNDATHRLVMVFEEQCLNPGGPGKFGVVNTLNGQTSNFTGTTAITRTNFSDFGAHNTPETLLVTRNYGRAGYLYKCTTQGQCVLDLQTLNQNLMGVALDPGHQFLYVTNKTRITKYPYGGGVSREAVASRNTVNAYGVDTDGAGNVYYTDLALNQIVVLDANLSTQLRTLGRQGSAPGQFNQPWGLHVMKKKNRLFVADRNNHRIQVLDPLSGLPYASFGSRGMCSPGKACPEGAFYEPRAVHVIEDENSPRFEQVIVADTGNHRVVFYNPPLMGF